MVCFRIHVLVAAIPDGHGLACREKKPILVATKTGGNLPRFS